MREDTQAQGTKTLSSLFLVVICTYPNTNTNAETVNSGNLEFALLYNHKWYNTVEGIFWMSNEDAVKAKSFVILSFVGCTLSTDPSIF